MLLSYNYKPTAGKLRRYTQSTITRRVDLAKEVERVRRRGWAEATGEREEDLNAIAAPVTGAYGKLIGVLGIQGPSGRFKPAARRACLPLLLSSAGMLSSEIGGRPETVDTSGHADGAAG